MVVKPVSEDLVPYIRQK